MQLGFKIITALLVALGTFVAAGVVELILKFLQERQSRRIRERAAKEQSVTDLLDMIVEAGPPDNKTKQNPAATIESFEWESGWRPRKLERVRPPVQAPEPKAKFGPFIALLLVVCVFAISIGVIWALTHIGGPIEAGVKTTIEKAGGSILIVGTGLFGAFFAVAFMAFAAIRVFSGSFDR